MAPKEPRNVADDAASSEDESFSVIDRLADAIRVEEDPRLNAEDRERIVKEVYEGPRKCQCCINWVDELPAKLKVVEPVAKLEDPSHPLLVRRRLMPSAGKALVSVHSIEVRHAGVRAVLCDVFQGLDGIMPMLRYLIFKPPFHPFFWRWDRFERAIEEQEDEYVKTVLIQLRAFVKKELADAFAISTELTGHGVITQEYLWTLFPPGEIIYSDSDGENQFFVLRSSGMSLAFHGPYQVRCSSVAWDGHGFGIRDRVFDIDCFRGTRKISDLAIFPAKYLENYGAVREQCIERGRKLISLTGIQYKAYRPRDEQGRNGGSKSKAQQINRRIVLDTAGHPSATSLATLCEIEKIPMTTGLITQAPIDVVPRGGHIPLPKSNAKLPAGVRPAQGVPLPPYPAPHHGSMPGRSKPKKASRRRDSFDSVSSVSASSIISNASDSEEEEDISPFEKYKLSDSQLLLTPSHMLGFCLKEKTWRSFQISRICDIDWNTAPFESLVLPEGYKDLILSFVESQVKEGDTFDDVINGKGGGLVILLSGETGVGKTLTAESVAEKMRAPLYKLELTNVHDIDDTDSGSEREGVPDIDSAFKLASRWKAVLLIDECDMHLEARSDASPKRNRLVARFLQKLEYYPSLLFLTTNRERILDPAIYSRIHLTINYPALDPPSRRRIWQNFLAREWASTVTEGELDQLAEIDVNGRRIRNITKTARIMAKRQKRGITFTDIRHVLRITEGLTIGSTP